MSIPLTGTGSFFQRLGRIGALLRALNQFRGQGVLYLTSLSGNGTTATATTLIPHGYTSSDTVTIAGCSTAGFNGSQTITVTSTTAFTFSNGTNATASAPFGYAYKTAGNRLSHLVALDNQIAAQYQSTDQNVIDTLYVNQVSYQQIHSSMEQYLTGLAQATLLQMAADDAPQPDATVATALKYLIAQMVGNSDSVKKPTVAVSSAAGGSNTGTGVLAVSSTGKDGLQLDYLFAEALVATCTSDAQVGSTAGQEPFSVAGVVAESNELQWDFPLGSGASTTLTTVDANLNNTGGNVLQNSGWATFTTTDTPDNWPIATGSAGTSVKQATGSNVYRGTSALSFVGDGAELTSIQQPFNTTPSTAAGFGGTSYQPLPNTVYALSLNHKVSASASSGVLQVALVDGSGSVINDAAGTANSFTVDLTTLSTSFSNTTGFFRTPAVLPTTIKLRLKLTTALQSGKTAYLSNLAMTPATQLYSGGPFAAIFAGSVNFISLDKFTVTVKNKYDSQFQLLMESLFGMRALGLQIPSASSPTVADTLIA